MARYQFDIEADGLLPALTKIHSIVLRDLDTGELVSCSSANDLEAEMLQGDGYSLEYGMARLAEATMLSGHNIIKYDIPALQKIYPKFSTDAVLEDTLVAAKLIWPMEILFVRDQRAPKDRRVPSHLIGSHSLEAWGYRLGEHKIKFEGPWDKWTPEMQKYCEQDVEVNNKLRLLIERQGYSKRAIATENAVQKIVFEQEQYGVCFDAEKASALYATLVQLRLKLERECQKIFAPWYKPHGKLFTPKRDNKKLGYVAGCEMQHIKLTEFNPGSRAHIINRLTTLRGWKPEEFTDGGDAKMDEAVLKSLDFPEAAQLGRFWTVQKRISQLAEGDKALLKKVCADGRIYGEVNTLGAVTRRASHHNPNLGQVPKVQVGDDKKPLVGEAGDFGLEFRGAFVCPAPYVMVGVDASGCQLRMLAHYLGIWDGGEYANQVLSGDPHEYTRQKAQLASRNIAKTYIFALLFGAGNEKLGKTGGQGAAAGKRSRGLLLANMPALDRLINLCKAKHRKTQTLIGLDGGILHTRSDYAALNTLLQAAEAIVCKEWMVLLNARLRETLVYGRDFAQVLWVHDEFQFYVLPQFAQFLIDTAQATIREVGESLKLRLRLDSEGKIGHNWAETH